jgi:DNA-binding transcriptional regulator YdaS (Cro superfamily)
MQENLIEFAIRASESKNASDFAARLGVSRSMVAHWKAGNREVSPEMAKKIELLTGGKINRAQLNDVFL